MLLYYYAFIISFKHGARLYLKADKIIVIIFKAIHWLENNENYSVVSVALLCVSRLLRQRKVIICSL